MRGTHLFCLRLKVSLAIQQAAISDTIQRFGRGVVLKVLGHAVRFDHRQQDDFVCLARLGGLLVVQVVLEFVQEVVELSLAMSYERISLEGASYSVKDRASGETFGT